MCKRSILIALCIAMLLSLSLNVYAAEQRVSASQPTLDFSGTNALCGFTFVQFGKHIEVTMELWYGNTLVDSWTKEGNHTVSFAETCPVVSGRTYTLKITGICGTETISCTPVSKRCP